MPLLKKILSIGSRYKERDDPKSPSYWLKKLKIALIDNSSSVNTEECKDIITGCVKTIDSQNSTHLKASGDGIEPMVKLIFGFVRNRLKEALKDPNYKHLDIMKKLSEPLGDKKHRNISFSSKFCHWACFYLFEGENAQDNFSVYDSVVRNMLPTYVSRLGLNRYTKSELTEYKTYQKCIDEILESLDEPISRHGFDRLVWFCYR